MHDVVIIGGSVAGLTAGLYASRKGIDTLVMTEKIGGQMMYAERIDNFPAFAGSGYELVMGLKKQAESSGAVLIADRVVRIERIGEHFKVYCNKEDYEAKAIIIASGKIPRKLGVLGEDRFIGKGVHMCAICDAPFYKGKKTAVLGGGNTALNAAISLAAIAEKVYLLNQTQKFTADQVLIDKVKSFGNVEIIPTSSVKEIKGEKFVSSIIIEDIKNNRTKELEVEGVFVEIGYEVNPSFFEGLIRLNEKNEIIIDEAGLTSSPGIFAAGDVSNTIFKQAIIAAAGGAKAALSAYAYLIRTKAGGDKGG